MNFGEAIEALKQGKKVTRKGWNGKKMFLYYVPSGRYDAMTDAAKTIADKDGKVDYGPYIAMKTAQGNVVPWLASQTDMLGEDWMIVGQSKEVVENLPEKCLDTNGFKPIEESIEQWYNADKENRSYIIIATDKNFPNKQKDDIAKSVFAMEGDESMNAFAVTKLFGEKRGKNFKMMIKTCLFADRLAGDLFKL